MAAPKYSSWSPIRTRPAGADVAQQPAEIGRTAIQNVAKLLAGQTLPRETYVHALIANKANVNEVTKKLGIG